MGDLPDRMPSGVLRIAIGGEPVIEHCAGLTDGPDGAPCTPGTKFQVASVSKQFTAAAVLVLAERAHGGTARCPRCCPRAGAAG
jgi:CubicO group peptidase (beta-lactamase class C family)